MSTAKTTSFRRSIDGVSLGNSLSAKGYCQMDDNKDIRLKFKIRHRKPQETKRNGDNHIWMS